jgi:hypothetical protein
MNQQYIDECKVIRQNCTYTAQTHHLMARAMRRQALWFQLVPACIAAATSAGTAFGIGWHELFPWLTLAASITTAIATVLNPNRSYQEHLAAAKSFTTLKHDARFLADAEVGRLGEEAFVERVRNLHEKYNALVQSVPATDEKYFKRAREIVQAGIHEPDKTCGKIT